tara:strand:+ start:376 stop:624 length:249 start_codon:yes stop_codon:yes gene_type:complete
MEKNFVVEAFDLARERYDSMAVVCGLLNISASYAYTAMNQGELSLPCSLKMEAMLDGDVKWEDLCPKMGDEIKTLKHRIAQY